MYTIEPRGEAVNLSLSGVQLDEIDPTTYQGFDTNDARPRWFDATRSIVAAPGRSWLAIADERPIAPELAPLLADLPEAIRATTIDDQRPYALFHFDLPARLGVAARRSLQQAKDVVLPVKFSESAELIGYEVKRTQNDLSVVTYWRALDHIQAPLQLFVHATGPDGAIVAQEDRLDVPAYGWRAGDLFAQVNRLSLPPETDLAALTLGFYDPATGARLPVSASGQTIGDQLALLTEAAP